MLLVIFYKAVVGWSVFFRAVGWEEAIVQVSHLADDTASGGGNWATVCSPVVMSGLKLFWNWVVKQSRLSGSVDTGYNQGRVARSDGLLISRLAPPVQRFQCQSILLPLRLQP